MKRALYYLWFVLANDVGIYTLVQALVSNCSHGKSAEPGVLTEITVTTKKYIGYGKIEAKELKKPYQFNS